MKISIDGQRRYSNHCPNCPNVQKSSQHVLNCPAIQVRFSKISPEDLEYSIFSKKLLRLPKRFSTASERSKSFLYQPTHHGRANNNSHSYLTKSSLILNVAFQSCTKDIVTLTTIKWNPIPQNSPTHPRGDFKHRLIECASAPLHNVSSLPLRIVPTTRQKTLVTSSR
ncbi:hypothetical protein TNCV_3431581 [Trichonephila clavipes]|nr:hypothetical protein TNCV_3431581 [Trichonephila clavipes]